METERRTGKESRLCQTLASHDARRNLCFFCIVVHGGTLTGFRESEVFPLGISSEVLAFAAGRSVSVMLKAKRSRAFVDRQSYLRKEGMTKIERSVTTNEEKALKRHACTLSAPILVAQLSSVTKGWLSSKPWAGLLFIILSSGCNCTS